MCLEFVMAVPTKSTSTLTTATTSLGSGSGLGGAGSSASYVFSQAQFQQLMSTVAVSTRIESTLDEKLEKLRQDLQKEQECNAEKLAKKARLDKPSSFRSKGNEEQHRFLEKTLLELENAGTELDKALAAAPGSSGSSSSSTANPLTSALQSATAFMKEGKRLVMQRQKLVRLADRSDHGWLVVNEYETDELADDEDDERRISKALKNAEKRVEAARKKKTGSSSWQKPGGAGAGRQQPYYRPPSFGGVRAPAQFGKPVVGPCFACHEYGHLRSSCPKVAGGVRGVLYPFESMIDGTDVQGGGNEVERVALVEIEEPCVDGDECMVTICSGDLVKGRLREHVEFWIACPGAHTPYH